MSDAMQWCGHGCYDLAHTTLAGHPVAEIVAWVNANGGEARYEGPEVRHAGIRNLAPVIALRTRTGWAFCLPGQWVVKGELFHMPGTEDSGEERNLRLREFTVSADLPASVAGSAER